MEIIVDTREPIEIDRAIELYQSEIHNNHHILIKITKHALETGDFAIIENGVPIAYIERKSWQDLAASIKDGRCESQWERLDALITKGYKVYWIIEGAIPSMTGKEHGMLNVCLHGKITHMISLGYNIIHSRDIEHTCFIVCNMARHFSIVGGYESVTARFINNLRLPSELNENLRKELIAVIDKYRDNTEDTEIKQVEFMPLPTVRKMWKVFMGNSKSIPELSSKYSIREILLNPELVMDFRYSSGKKMNNRDKIRERISDDNILKPILEAVKGISAELAIYIYNELGPQKLREMKEAIPLERNGRAINKKLLPRYIQCLDFVNRNKNI